jgi:Helix-turn-helix domain
VATRRPRSPSRHGRRKASAGADNGALTIGLPPEVVETIVERAAELIAARQPAALEPLLTVDELAEHLHVSPDWIRRHQAQLGGYRLSDGGGRNPVRFRVSDVERFLSERRLTPPRRAGDRWRDDPDWAAG